MNKTLIVQLTVIFAIVGSYFFIDFNEVYNSLRGEVKFAIQDKNCDLKKGPCEVTVKDGTKFELEVFPKHIPLMENITFRVKSSNDKLDNLNINIYATNMLMGYFNLKFKNLGNGIYETKGTLPTCPVGNMQWNADIELNKISERIGARFQFKTIR